MVKGTILKRSAPWIGRCLDFYIQYSLSILRYGVRSIHKATVEMNQLWKALEWSFINEQPFGEAGQAAIAAFILDIAAFVAGTIFQLKELVLFTAAELPQCLAGRQAEI